MKPLSETLFNGDPIGPSCKTQSLVIKQNQLTQARLEKHVPDFISESEWTLGSSDINPLNYELWAALWVKAYAKHYPNVEVLKILRLQQRQFPLEMISNSISQRAAAKM